MLRVVCGELENAAHPGNRPVCECAAALFVWSSAHWRFCSMCACATCASPLRGERVRRGHKAAALTLPLGRLSVLTLISAIVENKGIKAKRFVMKSSGSAAMVGLCGRKCEELVENAQCPMLDAQRTMLSAQETRPPTPTTATTSSSAFDSTDPVQIAAAARTPPEDLPGPSRPKSHAGGQGAGVL